MANSKGSIFLRKMGEKNREKITNYFKKNPYASKVKCAHDLNLSYQTILDHTKALNIKTTNKKEAAFKRFLKRTGKSYYTYYEIELAIKISRATIDKYANKFGIKVMNDIGIYGKMINLQAKKPDLNADKICDILKITKEQFEYYNTKRKEGLKVKDKNDVEIKEAPEPSKRETYHLFNCENAEKFLNKKCLFFNGKEEPFFGVLIDIDNGRTDCFVAIKKGLPCHYNFMLPITPITIDEAEELLHKSGFENIYIERN